MDNTKVKLNTTATNANNAKSVIVRLTFVRQTK